MRYPELRSKLPACMCVPCVQELSLQHISNLLWAYAVLGAMPQRLATAFAGELKRRLPMEQATVQQLVNPLWSLAVAQVWRHRQVSFHFCHMLF